MFGKSRSKVALLILLLLLITMLLFPRFVFPLGPASPLKPEWIRAGDYVTYLYSETALGATETIHVRETVIDDSGAYLNRMRIERFGEQTSPNFPSRLGHLQPSFEEATPNVSVSDSTLLTSETEVLSKKPEIELVRGLNNRTYEAYKFVFPVLFTLGEPCQCNMTVWYEKESLTKVRQLQWWVQDGMDVRAEQLIEDSNILQLAAPAEPTTPGKTVVTSTTTVYVKAPQTMVTTTVATTTTIVVPTTLTTTSTLTETSTEPSTYAWTVSATVAAVMLAVVLMLLQRRRTK